MRSSRVVILTALLLTACGGVARAELRLPAVIGDNMVLQQQSHAPLWGWAKPAAELEIRAEWLAAPKHATVAEDGTWRVDLPTPAAGGPFRITITGDGTHTLNNVLIGEVWVCGGQSNMEWSFNSGVINGDEELKKAKRPRIRLFSVPRHIAVEPEEGGAGEWVECTPDSVKPFTAIGYIFGRTLQDKLDVPVGLINCNWGGTVAEAWTSAAALRALGGFDEGLDVVKTEHDEPGSAGRIQQEQLHTWWQTLAQKDPGTAGGWMKPDANDAGWATMNQPGTWNTPDLSNFDGCCWLRREVELPADWAGKKLELQLGPIDDMDTTWFNGQRVGGLEQLGAWATPRQYEVPANAARAGKNVIAIRIIDTGGEGGLRGDATQLRIYPAGDGDEAISLAGAWRYHIGVEATELPAVPWFGIHANLPSVLYNGMLHPLMPFSIRGAIWYQGESNVGRAAQYLRLFPTMVADWRQHWQRGDFPFYYVQIAPFAYGGDHGQAAALRDAQRQALEFIPNSGMVVTLDIGNPRDIHPRNKQDVGQRLALWALANTYGQKGFEFSGPLYRTYRTEGTQVRLFFDHVQDGLTSGGEPLRFFTVAGADHVFHPAQAKIDDETVVVWSDEVPNPVAVRYAWGAADEPNLKNKAGLPAATFRTDDWDE